MEKEPTYEQRMSLGYYLARPDTGVIVEKGSISPAFEMTKTLLEHQAHPVFFKSVEGFPKQRVAGNLWSTRSRIAMSLGITKEQIPGMLEKAMTSPVACKVVKFASFEENNAPGTAVKDMPIPTYYRGDGGPYITAGIVIAKDGAGNVNVSFHRLMYLGGNRFAIRLVPRHLHKMFTEAEGDLQVVVALGLTPVVLLPAAMSVEYGVSELEISSALSQLCFGRPLEVKVMDSGIPVPASAEYVFTGRITKLEHDEGPFVDITGTFDKVRKQPILEVDRVYFQNNPIFESLLPGGLEHYLLMGLPREPVIAATVRKHGIDIRGVRLTEGGCSWLHGVVAIRKTHEDDGRQAIAAAFDAHRSMKKVTIVDEDIDIFDDRSVEWAVATRFQADKDLVILSNVQGSSLDPSAQKSGLTSKLGLDATKPVGAAKEFERVLP